MQPLGPPQEDKKKKDSPDASTTQATKTKGGLKKEAPNLPTLHDDDKQKSPPSDIIDRIISRQLSEAGANATPHLKTTKAEREQLLADVKLDEMSRSLLDKVEDGILGSGALSKEGETALQTLFAHFSRSSHLKVTPEALSAYANLTPLATTAALEMLQKRADITPNASLVDQALNSSTPEVQKSALKLLARRTDLPLSYEKLEIFLGPKSNQDLKLIAIETLRERPEISIPEDFFARITKRIPTDVAALSRPGKLEEKFDLLKDSQANTNIIEIKANALLAARGDAHAFEELRMSRAKDSHERALALDAISRSNILSTRYPLSDIIADRPKEINMDIFPPAIRRLIKESAISDAALSRNDARAGNDFRRAEFLANKIAGLPGVSLTLEQIRSVQMPLLNTLSEIERLNPRRWNELSLSNPKAIEEVAMRALSFHFREREELRESGRIIFGPSVKLLGFAHEEAIFDLDRFRDLSEQYGMKLGTVAKGTKSLGETALIKDEFLSAVGEAAADKAQDTTILFSAHGGPKHIYLSSGQAGVEISDVLDLSFAISYHELAHTLVDAQRKSQSGELDLSHLTCIQDACFQHDFAANMNAEIAAYAAEKEITVKGFPLMVAVSQRGTHGFGTNPLRSIFENEMRVLPRDKERPFTAADLLTIDESMTRQFRKASDQALEKYNQMRSLIGRGFGELEVVAEELGIFGTSPKERNAYLEHFLEPLGGTAYSTGEGSESMDLSFLPEKFRDSAPSRKPLPSTKTSHGEQDKKEKPIQRAIEVSELMLPPTRIPV